MTEQPRKRVPRKAAAKAADTPSEDVTDQEPDAAGVHGVNTPAETVQQTTAGPATVQAVGNWHLVTHGTWQISVGPDGMLMLPRHLDPDEVDDFIAAATVAKQVGADVINGNGRKAMKDNRSLPRRRAIVTEGAPPDGSVRMKVSQQEAAATIGRPRRGQRPTNPMSAGRATG